MACVPADIQQPYRAAVAKLRQDNAKLKEELLLENKFSVTPTSSNLSANIANLQDQSDVYTRKARYQTVFAVRCVCSSDSSMVASLGVVTAYHMLQCAGDACTVLFSVSQTCLNGCVLHLWTMLVHKTDTAASYVKLCHQQALLTTSKVIHGILEAAGTGLSVVRTLQS